ncbi:MAG TPA: AbrB/MazE/SpoVT family DNA-binding domain-containing protein [Candidatus Binataceae bacterium]|jgi:antitoxin PrlF|nr:AbrB/MazE/SpoVT family DNA-binding domain-containing protein [Candidatus Binataceae bacterium]
MKSMKARIAERGQVTIPKALRNRLGMTPGTVLEFSEERGHLIAVKHGVTDSVARVYGSMGKKIHTNATLRKLRGHHP